MLHFRNISVVKRKLLIGFKYIRFKFLKRDLTNDLKEVLNVRTNKLAEILDCSKSTAKLMILRNKSILALPYEDLVRNATFCKKYLKWGDIIDFPMISTNSGFLQHRYFSLLELGCVNISAREIFRYQQILKMTPKELRKQKLNILRGHSLKHFDTNPHIYGFMKNETLTSKLQKLYEEDSNLGKIKETMNVEFLQSKLNCSLFKVQQMFRRYPPLRSQSIFITTLLLQVLSKDYKFPVSKIFQVPSILSLHHEVVKLLLDNSPEILGIKTPLLAIKYPLIIKQTPERVKQIETILKNYNISGQQLLSCPRIVAFMPSTLRKRLQYLCSSEDFALMKPCKNFLWLAHHNNILASRLQTLKEFDKPISISLFMASNTTFTNYLNFGSKCRSHIKDVCQHLAETFNYSELEIHTKLLEFPGPHNSSVRNSNDVIHYLLSAGVSKKQIFNGLGVIFYDVDIVKLYFEELQTNPAYQPFSDWAVHYNLVQLLIYAIEVDTGFKGSRVYGARTKSDSNGGVVASGYAC